MASTSVMMRKVSPVAKWPRSSWLKSVIISYMMNCKVIPELKAQCKPAEVEHVPFEKGEISADSIMAHKKTREKQARKGRKHISDSQVNGSLFTTLRESQKKSVQQKHISVLMNASSNVYLLLPSRSLQP